MPTLDKKIDFRCTEEFRKKLDIYLKKSPFSKRAELIRHVLEQYIHEFELFPNGEIIYQEGALVGSEDPYKLFRKVSEQ